MELTPVFDGLAREWSCDPDKGTAGLLAVIDGRVAAAQSPVVMGVLVPASEGPQGEPQMPAESTVGTEDLPVPVRSSSRAVGRLKPAAGKARKVVKKDG